MAKKKVKSYVDSARFIFDTLNVFMNAKDLEQITVSNAGATVTILRKEKSSEKAFAVGFSYPEDVTGEADYDEEETDDFVGVYSNNKSKQQS
mgnify:FL=1